MAYWLDDGFDTWPQAIRAGSAAVGLYIRCGAWIARNTHDGLIPAEVAALYGTPEWIKRLVDVGLWEADGNGYRDVHFHAMGNPDAATVAKRRADAAERQRRFREARDKKRVTRDKTRDSRVSNAGSDGGSHRSPALPPSYGGAGGAPARSAGRSAPPSTPPPSDDGERDWRALPAFGAEREPDDAERTRQRATEARAAIRRPTPPPRRNTLAELTAAVDAITTPAEAQPADQPQDDP